MILFCKRKMTPLRLLFTILLLNAFFGCASAPDKEPKIGPPPNLTMAARNEFDRIIHEYARTKKGWSQEEHSIELVGSYSNFVLFTRHHRDDIGPLATAGG